jgi:hypothetical protein
MSKRTIVTAISLVLLIMPVTSAAEFNLEQEILNEYKEVANSNSDKLPDFVKNLVGDQNINVYVNRDHSESFNMSLKMNGTQVEAIGNHSLEDPDLEIWTSTDIIQNISESERPVEQVKAAIDEDKIRYEANDTWTKIQLFFAETFMSFF